MKSKSAHFISDAPFPNYDHYVEFPTSGLSTDYDRTPFHLSSYWMDNGVEQRQNEIRVIHKTPSNSSGRRRTTSEEQTCRRVLGVTVSIHLCYLIENFLSVAPRVPRYVSI